MFCEGMHQTEEASIVVCTGVFSDILATKLNRSKIGVGPGVIYGQVVTFHTHGCCILIYTYTLYV